MDAAVAVVQAYLRFNGYFTVTEYDVIEALETGEYRTTTDIDVMAVRLPGAGRYLPGRDITLSAPDPALEASDDQVDLIIGEVKQGAAELNRAARDPGVLRVALARFGAVAAHHADELVAELVRTGEVESPIGARIRLAAFGSKSGKPNPPYFVMTLGHMVRYLQRMTEEHWDVAKMMTFSDPAMSFISLAEKARRGD